MSGGDLFGELATKITDPIVGLKVQMPSPCKCGCAIARIAEGQWLHVPLLCTKCGVERTRLTYEAFKFIRRVVEIFGRPTQSIKLKQSDFSKQFPLDAESSRSNSANRA